MDDFQHEMDEAFALRRMRRRFMLPAEKPLINLILFLLTIASTWLMWGKWYSLAVVAVLGSHEMGHFVACRLHGMRSTLPFFIPFPFANPFGTLGAVIQIRTPFINRRSLFDVGAAGPIAGLIAAVAVLILGFLIEPAPSFKTLSASFLPHPQPLLQAVSMLMRDTKITGAEILANPLIYAGWVGLFVTSLNLLPVGQLDGGHILYSVFGCKTLFIMPVFIFLLGILAFFYWSWAAFFVILLLFGKSHPPPLDDSTPIDRKRKLLALLAAVFFAVTFTPFPFSF